MGIGEILGMAGVPAEQLDNVKDLLSDDPNLSFQFRQLTIENPSALGARARYFRTRDHLDSPEMKAAMAPHKHRTGRIGLDTQELRVPPEKIPET
jgi:hypothetical protein